MLGVGVVLAGGLVWESWDPVLGFPGGEGVSALVGRAGCLSFVLLVVSSMRVPSMCKEGAGSVLYYFGGSSSVLVYFGWLSPYRSLP